MNLLFEGAARMVTGSCYLLSACEKKILIDCGMRQGTDKKTDDGAFSFDMKDIDALLITHAHIDHTGLVPLIVKQGFRGKIYATTATKDLSEIMLADSGHIQEMEAEWKSRKAVRAGHSAIEPLYTADDGTKAAQQIITVEYGETFELFPGIVVNFLDAGHLLGSAMIKLWIKEGDAQKELVFSGDIGNFDRPILRDPTEIVSADCVVMESTYGDRLHPPREDQKRLLAEIIKQTFEKGGNVVFPSFAVGRTQELLYDLSTIMHEGMAGLKPFDVYVDSPLSSKATYVFSENFNSGYFDDQAIKRKQQGDDPFTFETLHFVETADDSKALNFIPKSKVIISSSGMCEAGRIKHHLKHNLFRKECAIVFVGYQAEGTLGRVLVDGAKRVQIFGEEIEVNAAIHRLEGFSGHADQAGLLEWVGAFGKRPKVFVTHGEEEVAVGFAQLLTQRGFDAVAPREGDLFDLVTGVVREAPEKPKQVQSAEREPNVAVTGQETDWSGMRKRLRQESDRLLETAKLLEYSLKVGMAGKRRREFGELLRQIRDTANAMIKN